MVAGAIAFEDALPDDLLAPCFFTILIELNSGFEDEGVEWVCVRFFRAVRF